MILTNSHLQFWRDKKCPDPSWHKKKKNDNKVSIHTLINDHAGIRLTDGERQAHNTLWVIRGLKRHEGQLISGLSRMACNPGTVISPKRRAGFCRKWLEKMQNKIVFDSTGRSWTISGSKGMWSARASVTKQGSLSQLLMYESLQDLIKEIENV